MIARLPAIQATGPLAVALAGLPPAERASLRWTHETVRYFPDKLPIGLDADGRAVFVYVVTRDLPIDFRAFLERHAELWRRLPAWTLRLLVPRHKTKALLRYEAAAREQIATPLAPDIVEEFRWYAHARRRPPDGSEEHLDQAVRAFGAPRFQAVYRAWQEHGDMVIDALSSHTLKDHLEWGVGRWECQVLPHPYARLLPQIGDRLRGPVADETQDENDVGPVAT